MLFWGIFGALVLRAMFIFAGVALIERSSGSSYVFGCVLLYSAWKIARHDEAEVDPDQNPVLRLVRQASCPPPRVRRPEAVHACRNAKRVATPLFAVLIMVETTDVVFAVDSIPAILAVSPRAVHRVQLERVRHPRPALAVLPARTACRTGSEYLNIGLGMILAFVGVKMLAGFFIDWHPPTWSSLLRDHPRAHGHDPGVDHRRRPAAGGGGPPRGARRVAATRGARLDGGSPIPGRHCYRRNDGRPPRCPRRSLMGIVDDDIVRVRESADIVAVIIQHTQLKQVGRRWQGLCPFHGEKSAVVLGQPGARASTTASAARPRATSSRSCARSSTSTSSAPSSGSPAGPASRCATPTTDEGEGRKRRAPAASRPSAQAVDWYHERLLIGARRRRGPPATCVAGASTATRCGRYQIGWAPDDWDAAGPRRCKLPDEVAAATPGSAR